MAILGLSALMAAAVTPHSAEAARGDRGPVARPHAIRAVPPASRAVPQATRTIPHTNRAIALPGNRRVVGSARGGHAPRVAARSQSVAGRDRNVAMSRGRGARVAIVQGRGGHGQHAGLQRSGYRAGYQSAVLRAQGNRYASMPSCSTVRGRRVCGGHRTVAMRWSGGLAPAAGQQSSCPDGTIATLAVGHENVVRCVPM